MDDDFAAALQKAGNERVTSAYFPTDHAYSNKRIELSAAVRKWLETVAAR